MLRVTATKTLSRVLGESGGRGVETEIRTFGTTEPVAVKQTLQEFLNTLSRTKYIL